MELANVMVALGGDRDNTVPKYRVTPPEIAVLCAIHGFDAVFDIEPLDDEIEVNPRELIVDLLQRYPALDDSRNPIVRNVYPGVSPVLHQSLADLGLAAELYKPTEREKPKAVAKRPKKVERAEPIVQPEPGNSADSLFEDA
jgi:hypothetical protein